MRAYRDVEAAYDREKVERQKAEDRLRLAIEATNQIYLKFNVDHYSFFGASKGPPTGPLTPEDRQLLQKIVRFYEQLTVPVGGEPSHRREVVEAWLRIANLRNTLKMHNEAVVAGTQAVEISQRLASEFPDVPEYKKVLAEALEGRGYSYYTIEAIRLDPKQPGAYELRGGLFFKKRDFTQAIAAYDKALDIDPNSYLLSPLVYYNRGTAQTRLHRFRRAITDYDAALAIRPKFYSALHNRASAHAKSGHLDEAIEDYTAALRLDPTGFRSYHARGRMYLKQRKFAQAVDDFRQALRHDSKGDRPREKLVTGQLYSDVAWLLASCPDARLRDADRAVELAGEAAQLSLFDETFILGVARYRAGDWQGSIDDLEQSAKDACGWSFLAMAHWQLNEKQQARQWHERAIAWLQQNQPKQPAFRRFCVESAELLGLDPPPESTEQKLKLFTDPMIYAWSAWEDPR